MLGRSQDQTKWKRSLNILQLATIYLRMFAHCPYSLQKYPFLKVRVCSFRRFQKRIFDPRFAEIGFVILVTFRKSVQYVLQPQKK